MSRKGAIRAAIDAIALGWDVPGGVAVITDRDGDLFEYAFGFADRERGVNTTADHLFAIGSISKGATATVVLQLVEQGLLTLDTPIVSVLPWLEGPLADPQITIELLLRHSAGITSGIDAVPDEVGQLAGYAEGPSPVAIGSLFHYSNLGFILLGRAAAAVSGESLTELVRTRLLEPLGMRDSIAAVLHEDRPRFALGYQPVHDARSWVPGDEQLVAPWLEVDGADGAIAATASDLARFARMLLAGGAPILTPESFEAMTTRVAVGGEDTLDLTGIAPVSVSRYGFGVNVEETDGRRALSHGGGMVGYASFLLADLDRGLGITVLTNANGDSPVAEAIARVAFALWDSPDDPVAPLDPRWWSTEAGRDSQRPRVLDEGMLGSFKLAGTNDELTLSIAEEAGGRARVEVGFRGATAPLNWSWADRAVTRHLELRRFGLLFEAGTWVCGPLIFERSESAALATSEDESGAASEPSAPDVATFVPESPFVGHYRSYNPWFTSFRVVQRPGTLLLIANVGVEAPWDEVELVILGVDAAGRTVFRLGPDPRLPERLVFGPLIDGRAPWVERDGDRYSRAFTE
jgi:CubicO group peptidase (beta-lactamase class C family)